MKSEFSLNMFMLKYFLVVLLAKMSLSQNDCTTPDNQPGSCVLVNQCPYFQSMLVPPIPRAVHNLLRTYICGFRGLNSLVCCPRYPPPVTQSPPTERPTTTFRPRPPVVTPPVASGEYREPPPRIEGLAGIRLLPTDCGESDRDKAFNGQITGPIDYPWMALLSYSQNGTRAFKCGGTIINERYILTAAHCITNLDPGTTLIGVRVGEHDITTNMDCLIPNELDSCVTYQDIPIESTTFHPEFNQSAGNRDDVGLIRLSQPIDLTVPNALPICLPLTRELMEDDGENETMIITGWGVTQSNSLRMSSELMQVNVSVENGYNCGRLYNLSVWGGISYKQVCAGGNLGRACQGDSGGPMKKIEIVSGVQRYVQHGIVSFGYDECGSFAPIPGVLTRVAYYMDWILNQLRP